MNVKNYLSYCLPADLYEVAKCVGFLEKSPLFKADPGFAGKVTAVKAAVNDLAAYVDSKQEKRK